MPKQWRISKFRNTSLLRNSILDTTKFLSQRRLYAYVAEATTSVSTVPCVFPVPTSGCGTLELTGPKGEFGTSGSQYDNHMSCSWKVSVEAGMVRRRSLKC